MDSPERWVLEFYDFLTELPGAVDVEVSALGDIHERSARNDAQHGTPILVPPSGRPDPRVNLFFRVPPMKGKRPTTWRRYAHSLKVWLEFLDTFGLSWDAATPGDVEAFKDWRLTDVRNDGRIMASSFDADRAALNTFYTWASNRYGVRNPVPTVATATTTEHAVNEIGPGGRYGRRDGLRPAGARRRQVKWMLRPAFEQWRDVGLRGYGFDGLRRSGWRGAQEDRDLAFVDGLYGTGLRLREWASVLDVELPPVGPSRFPKAWLSAACIKGGREGRIYRVPRSVLRSIASYTDVVEGSRTEAIRRAQHAGRYDRLPFTRIVTGYNVRTRVLYLQTPQGSRSLPADVLGPDERRLLFRQTPDGLEPLALWLSTDGLPKKPYGWEDTFSDANRRIQRVWTGAGGMELASLWATPHMCRHSFALKWFSILSQVWQPSVEGFTDTELADLREMFGDVWYQLSTLLGHADPATTRDVYLEPFTALRVDYLMSLLDDEETVAVDALIRAVAAESGRTLAPLPSPAPADDPEVTR